MIAGVAGGKHVVDEPLTTDITREASPDLLLNEIDQQIVKIRPMATPIDQLSRCAGSKHSGSMIVDYHNVDTKPTHHDESGYDEPAATKRVPTAPAQCWQPPTMRYLTPPTLFLCKVIMAMSPMVSP